MKNFLVFSFHLKISRQFKEGLLQFIILTILSYGLFYFSYKYYTPWMGGSDFKKYYDMYQHPLDFSVAPAPFVFRQLSAIVTYAIHQLGIYYPNEIAFQDPDYNQRIFFAALCANYICLVITAWLSGRIVEIMTQTTGGIFPLLSGMICLLSFHSQSVIITGLTEGMSWLLLTAGVLAYLGRRSISVAIIVVFSLIQRETIIIVFGCIAIHALISGYRDYCMNINLLLWAMVSALAYIILRNFSGISGNEHQTDPQTIILTIGSFHLSKDIIFQGLVSQNILIAYVTTLAFDVQKTEDQIFWLKTILLSFFALFVVGIATGIGNNIGRICGILTPIGAALMATTLQRFELRWMREYQ